MPGSSTRVAGRRRTGRIFQEAPARILLARTTTLTFRSKVIHPARSSLSFQPTFSSSGRKLIPGSAIYIYGDQVNDHGLYDIYLNGTDSVHLYATLNGRSGCGGGYAKACEKLHGLAAFIGELPAGTHDVRLVNKGPSDGNVTYFGE